MFNAHVDALHLDIHYDDGFAAFLNGVPIASRNAPTPLRQDSMASEPHAGPQALQVETVDISSARHLLRSSLPEGVVGSWDPASIVEDGIGDALGRHEGSLQGPVVVMDAEHGPVLSFDGRARLCGGCGSVWQRRSVADGSGPSLMLVDPEQGNGAAWNWRSGIGVGGTPGWPNWISAGRGRVSVATDELKIVWDPTPGMEYQLEHKHSLNGEDWFPIGEPIVAPGAEVVFHADLSVWLIRSIGFYRVRVNFP